MNLQAKVKAVNAAHAAANEWYPRLIEVFKPFVGQKVLKADGTFIAKIDKLVKGIGLPYKHNLQVYLFSKHSLTYIVKTSEMDSEHTCLYYETSFCIGKLANGVLVDISEQNDAKRTDYTVEEVMHKQDVCKNLRNQLDKAISDLWPFKCLY